MADINTWRDGGVGWVELNRPEKRNALSAAMRDGLSEVFSQWAQDDGIRSVVIVGAGTKAFCAGQDLKEDRGEASPLAELERKRQGDFRIMMSRFEKPIVCAVHGHCLGAGMDIAVYSDLRLATPEATFAYPEVRYGMMPGNGGIYRTARLVGLSVATALVLLGQTFTAEQAREAGLVNGIASNAQLRTKAGEWAAALAEYPPYAVRYIKRALLRSGDLSPEDGFTLETSMAAILRTSTEMRAQVDAFREGQSQGPTGRE